MSSPAQQELSPALRDVAAALYASLEPLRSTPHLEVEMRLCKLTVPACNEPGREPCILRNGLSRGRITVGVSAPYWNAIQVHLQSRRIPSTDENNDGRNPLQPKVEVTEDVSIGPTRYTYRFPAKGVDDGAVTLVESIGKGRKLVRDIALPGCLYDLRLSASVEDPRGSNEGHLGTTATTTSTSTRGSAAAPSPPSPPSPPLSLSEPVKADGRYRRRKARTTYTDGSYRYDCTVVSDSARKTTYEVEVEGVFDNTAAELTLAWVEGLVARAAALTVLDPTGPIIGLVQTVASRSEIDDKGGELNDESADGGPPRKRLCRDVL